MTSMLKNEQAVPVNALCRYVTDLCRLKVHSNISVRFASTLGDHYTVNVNEEALRQLLCRLLDDAIHHTTAGHVVLTTTDAVPVLGLTFAVSDTRGIRSAHRPSALNTPGTAADGDNSPLASCQYLARLLGGTLRPDPDYQRGTRIILALPTITQ